jgi:hypothetical protein
MDICVVWCKYRQKGKVQHIQDKEPNKDEVQSKKRKKKSDLSLRVVLAAFLLR